MFDSIYVIPENYTQQISFVLCNVSKMPMTAMQTHVSCLLLWRWLLPSHFHPLLHPMHAPHRSRQHVRALPTLASMPAAPAPHNYFASPCTLHPPSDGHTRCVLSLKSPRITQKNDDQNSFRQQHEAPPRYPHLTTSHAFSTKPPKTKHLQIIIPESQHNKNAMQGWLHTLVCA